jgi:S-adenosylmethionine:tRNA ribosyltransferase-isomerase
MKDIAIDDYSYDLPSERIAHYPLEERDLSKLLIFRDGVITEDIYRNLAAHLPARSLVVFNNSRVIEARIIFSKASGGKIEVFCLEPTETSGSISEALQARAGVSWICLIGGASKWKAGQVLEKPFFYRDKEYTFSASFSGKTSEAFIINFTWTHAALTFAEVLHLTGNTPLPPYIKRNSEPSDTTRYQTIYAEPAGSVAAPTAGLHFTEAVLTALHRREIAQEFVTLHVGAGTFKPVKATTMADHEMHAEVIEVQRDTIRELIRFAGQHITAVGTTSMRTIESLYWMGVKVLRDDAATTGSLEIGQWYAVENHDTAISLKDALIALDEWMRARNSQQLISKTQLLIGPGYKFRVADALVTNFHQPRSTLLLLVAAIAGENWRSIYDHALAHDFRFLSYGDGCLIFTQNFSPGTTESLT